MKKSKRVLCLLLVCFTLVTLFCACGEEATTTAQSENATTTAKQEEQTTPEETTEAETIEVVDLSQGGDAIEFNILARSNRYDYLYQSERPSDAVYQTVYDRNALVEDQFGIEFLLTQGTGSDKTEKNNFNAVLSGAMEFDLAVPDYWWGLELTGCFIDLETVDEFDTDASYWYDGYNQNLKINQKQYTVAGDASLELLENMEAVFYNIDKVTGYYGSDENLYEDVTSGKWTFSKMLTICKDMSDVIDKSEDQIVYGALFDMHSINESLFAAGVKLSTVEENGALSFTVGGSEDTVLRATALGNFFADESIYYSGQTARQGSANNINYKLFLNQQGIFFCNALWWGKSLKETELSYGILPVPKYSESEDYVSTIYGVSPFAIPTTAKNYRNSVLVLNAMNYYSGRGDDTNVVYAYFDVLLKRKVAQDEESFNILEMIRERVYVDAAFIYNDSMLNLHSYYFNVLRSCAKDKTDPAFSATTEAVEQAENYWEQHFMDFYNS